MKKIELDDAEQDLIVLALRHVRSMTLGGESTYAVDKVCRVFTRGRIDVLLERLEEEAVTTIVITRNEEGKICGFGEKARKAWLKLVAAIRGLRRGEVMKLSYKFPRNGPFHRLHFVMLGKIFENQLQFEDIEEMRMWLQVGAGHCKFVPGPKGHMVALPLSISYDAIDDHEMREHHEKVKDFLRSERAQEFLWGHLSPDEQMNKVDGILRQFERYDDDKRSPSPEFPALLG